MQADDRDPPSGEPDTSRAGAAHSLAQMRFLEAADNTAAYYTQLLRRDVPRELAAHLTMIFEHHLLHALLGTDNS